MEWWYVAADKEFVLKNGGADHQPNAPSLRVLARWYAKKP